MRYRYWLYGFAVALPLPAPGLAPAGARDDDIVCGFGEVPSRLEDGGLAGPGWQANARQFLYDAGPQGGRLLTEDGGRVVLQPAPGASCEQRLYLMLQVGLPVALIQRGALVLHAAVAASAGGAVALCGPSGAGKSTTLAILVSRGFSMLTDDVAVLRRSPDGRPEAAPGAPQLHLKQDAAARLAPAVATTAPQPWRRMKLAFAAAQPAASGPVPLRALYVLAPQPGGALRSVRLSGRARFNAIRQAIAGPTFPGAQALAFPALAAVLSSVPAIRIERPADRWSGAEVADLILSECA